MTERRTTEPRTNWAGNISFGHARFRRPESVAQLQELVAASERIRPLGTGHSFNRLADTEGDLVTVAGLPPTVEVDAERRTVAVAGGVRYGELAGHLHAKGFALHNLASLPHISVAGACATGTHGSGVRNGSLSSAVTGVDVVTASGELVTINRETDPARFPGTVVSLGALGFITSLTLQLEPAFQMRQYVYENLPNERLDKHWAEIVGSGYSVSLVTDWTKPVINQVWVKQRTDVPAPLKPPTRWLDATLADGPRHLIAGRPPAACTEQLGIPGPWLARLPHFRMEFTPSSGEELQSEFLMPSEYAIEALRAIDRIRDQVSSVLQISEIRTVAADDLWLSPSYGRDSVAIHFTWVKDTAAVAPVVAAVEQQLAPFEARPHWGKLFDTEPEVVRGSYERFPDFQALCQTLDPGGKFRNELLQRYLGI